MEIFWQQRLSNNNYLLRQTSRYTREALHHWGYTGMHVSQIVALEVVFLDKKTNNVKSQCLKIIKLSIVLGTKTITSAYKEHFSATCETADFSNNLQKDKDM